MSTWGTMTWDIARTGGFVAFGLVTLSIALGLILSLRWYSAGWPRWATTDLHRYVTLLALVFTGVHTVAIWLDPFMQFGPGEVLVPMMSHYRPFWVALGIVAAYLLVAIWLSERIQRRVGYAWWRRLHYLSFVIYGLVVIHGIGTGSDTRTTWALAIYAGSFVLVGSLLAIRLLTPGKHMRPHPRIASLVALIALLVTGWTVAQPLRPGWNALANGGRGSGARVALAASNASGALLHAFTASLQGTATQDGGNGFGGGLETVRLDTRLSGGLHGTLRIVLQGQPDFNGGLAVARSQVSLAPSGSSQTYQGQVDSMNGTQLTSAVTDANGHQLELDISLEVDAGGNVTGSVQGR